ncbi:MAG: M23 family metallopeptidase, partial [Candidatus Polarisedimenticolia bacterium]
MRIAAAVRTGFIKLFLLGIMTAWSPAQASEPGGSAPILVDDGDAPSGTPGETTQDLLPLVCGGSPGFPAGPIQRFVAPIEPWVPSGLGWGAEAVDEKGEALCETNRPPLTDCDPLGPRPFLHAGFDAAPAPDRAVRASAKGRVVAAFQSLALVSGLGTGERGGVVVLEHDNDGDAATTGDRVLTMYAHVDPLVASCDLVEQGQVIARTMPGSGASLHFGVHRGPFAPGDTGIFAEILPPPGTSGCLPCSARPLPQPAFPAGWEDPERLVPVPTQWAALYRSGYEDAVVSWDPGDILEIPGGFIATATTEAPAPDGGFLSSIWLLRLDRQGGILSQRAFGAARDPAPARLAPAMDGGFVVLASLVSADSGSVSPLVARFDAELGQPQWQHLYTTGAGGLDGHDLRATADGGYVMAGRSRPCSGCLSRALVVKLDRAGEVEWARSYRSFSEGLVAGPGSIAQLADGGYVIAAVGSVGFGVPPNLLVFRIDDRGNLLWVSSFDTGLPLTTAQIATTEHGTIGISATYPFSGGMQLINLLLDGSLNWQTGYRTTQPGLSGTGIVAAADGGFILAGDFLRDPASKINSVSDMLMLKVDSTGEIVQQRLFGSGAGRLTTMALHGSRDGGFVMAGGSFVQAGGSLQPGPPMPVGGGFASGLVLVKTNADLEVSGGCGRQGPSYRIPTGVFPTSRLLVAEDVAVSVAPAELSLVTTNGRDYPCADGAYGPPPVIESAAIRVAEEQVQCDITDLLLDFLCTVGFHPLTTLGPVLLAGSYSRLELEAEVTDADSTPDRNDLLTVESTFHGPDRSIPLTLELLDDGSGTEFLYVQYHRGIPERCFDDPISGQCMCEPAFYSLTSRDLVAGDGIYTRAAG